MDFGLSYILLQHLGIGVFRESNECMIALNNPPMWMKARYPDQWDENFRVFRPEPLGFLESFMTEELPAGEGRSTCAVFKETGLEENEIAGRATKLRVNGEILYCLEAMTELDEYRQELLQRIRSHDLMQSNFGTALES